MTEKWLQCIAIAIDVNLFNNIFFCHCKSQTFREIPIKKSNNIANFATFNHIFNIQLPFE